MTTTISTFIESILLTVSIRVSLLTEDCAAENTTSADKRFELIRMRVLF
jgi:hypothetical protein